MSEFRRRLMQEGGGFNINNYVKTVQRFTSTESSTITIPTGAEYMDIFLVGGGGGGGSWKTWNYTMGAPGLGGHCFCKRMIDIKGLTQLTYQCGTGGSKATSTTEEALSATNGYPTILTVNNIQYSADGGAAGINSANQVYLSTYTLNNATTYYISFFQKCTNQIEYSTLTESEFGIEGDFMKGLLSTDYNNTGYWITPEKYWEDSQSTYYQNLQVQNMNENCYNASTTTSIDIPIYGIPEFFEEGNYTHAAQGSLRPRERHTTTYGPIGFEASNFSDSPYFYIHSGSGYGGGGFGGTYRSSEIKYGGNGTQGIVVIRWYIRK